MKVGLVGVGGAGGRIAAAIRRVETDTDYQLTDGNVLCFDTDRDALDSLSIIPSARRVPIGDTVERVARGPIDGDADLAASVARTDDHEIHRSFDEMPVETLDAIIVAAGIGGGTGPGAGAVILEMCQQMFDLPVYGIVALPHDGAGPQAARNAARSLQSFVRIASSVMPLDNALWFDEEASTQSRDRANEILAERLVRFLAVGDFGGVLAERRADRTDIMRTLEPGGLAAVGMATEVVYPGWRRFARWLPWVRPTLQDGQNPAYRIKDVVARAAAGPLTVECDIESAERALVVLSGPPSVLSRRGFESARYWLEQTAETVEVIAGDEPQPRSRTLRAVVVFSNVTAVPRIEELQRQALAGDQ